MVPQTAISALNLIFVLEERPLWLSKVKIYIFVMPSENLKK